jgi:predicted metalloprotease with PDZ domain
MELYAMKNLFQLVVKRSLLIAFTLLFVFNLQAQTSPFKISYELMMTNPASHLFEVRMRIETPAPEVSLDLQMPRWSPGRYAVVDFAKGVQEVRASTGCPANIVDCLSGPLAVTRMDTQTWRINPNKQKIIVVTYKVFANNLSGTFSQLDERHANYNGGTIFMYAVNHKQDPVQLKISPPANWKIINGRMTSPQQTEWNFDNYDILIDTPTEIAPDWTVDEFRVDGKRYQVMVHSFGNEGGKRPQFVKDVEKIVRAETAMMPAPDYDSYTFIFHFAPKNETGGDGMEHLTSTQIIETDTLASENGYEDALSTAAHEFFHVWNVKRLRPVGLGPWDFTQPVSTRGLFIAEGFTNYYGKMMQHRSGLWTDKQLIDSYSRTITGIENSPGNKLISAVEASVIAPFLDRASRVQNTNLANTTFSYYPKGELIALTLDLLIRKRSNGKKSLDDVMRQAYDEFYLKSAKDTYYLKGRGYTVEDFEKVASQVAGVDMTDFFTKYVRDVQTSPYDEGLEFVGLKLTQSETVGPSGEKITIYKIEELPNASAEMIIRRKSWLSGK